MLEEQFDAVWDQLMSDDNAEIREKIFSVCEEDDERGAEMIITFATGKGLKLDATADELVDHLENLDDDEDIELTPEMLADVAGGRRSGMPIMRRYMRTRRSHPTQSQFSIMANRMGGFH